MNIPWIRKYVAVGLDDIIGQETAIRQMRSYYSNFKRLKKRALFLHGPSGTGKTAAVHALAKENDLELIEVNASDARNKKQIIERIGGAAEQMSLFAKGKIILVDEVDGLSGTKDRGGIPAIVNIIKKTTYPIIMTGQNPYDKKFNKLRNASEVVAFNPIGYADVAQILARIVAKEGVDADMTVLKTLGRRCAGDARAAINDLQTIFVQTGKITREGIDALGDRNQTDSIVEALMKVMKSTDPNVAINAYSTINENLDEVMLWLDKNMPQEYEKPADLVRAYDMISKADVFKSRIRRWQHWRFLVYVNAFLSAGVAVAKDEKYRKIVDYKPTGRILKMWWAKQKNMKKKAIAEKLALHTHTSIKQMLKNIDYYRSIFKRNNEMADAIADQVDLDKDEIAWLRK